MRKGILALFLLLLCLPALAQITVTAPADGGTYSNPVHVVASGPSDMTALAVYVDTNLSLKVVGNQIDTTLTLAGGTHRFVVQGWNPDGTVTKVVENITVTATSYVNTYTKLDEKLFSTCGNCGNTGATGGTAPYKQTLVSSPSEDGKDSKFYIDAKSGTFDNGYWWLKQYPNHEIKHLVYEFDMYVPAQYATAPQAIEFELERQWKGYRYNLAFQANYAAHEWRTFDYVNRRWVNVNLAFGGFEGDKWHHVKCEFTLDLTAHVSYRTNLQIDGIDHRMNFMEKGKYTGGSSYYLSNGFQLDSNRSGTAYAVYVDKMSVGTD